MVQGIAQLILPASDLPRMAWFYGEQLGLAPLTPAPGVSPEHWLCFNAGSVELVLQAVDQPAVLSAESRRSGPCGATPRFVFRVSDMEAAREVLTCRGVPLGDVHAAQPGVQVCLATDPEGNCFLIEARD